MSAAKISGLVVAGLAPFIMLGIGLLMGWGLFPAPERDIPEIVGTMITQEHCTPVFTVGSVDEAEQGDLNGAIAQWRIKAESQPGMRRVQSAQFPEVVDGRIVYFLYYETCDSN